MPNSDAMHVALLLLLTLAASVCGLQLNGLPRSHAAARAHTLLAIDMQRGASSSRKRCKRPGPKPVVPTLREADLRKLDAGKRVQRQDLVGGSGSGYAVQDIRADPDKVWRHISDFTAYDRLIGTVRTAQAYSPTQVIPGTGCYRFTVSRLRLCLDVRFCVDDDLRYAYWTLEQPSWVSCHHLALDCGRRFITICASCTRRHPSDLLSIDSEWHGTLATQVLSDSTGFWHVEQLEEKPGYVRVWFCAAVVLAPVVPNFVVRLVSRLGLQKVRTCGTHAEIAAIPRVHCKLGMADMAAVMGERHARLDFHPAPFVSGVRLGPRPRNIKLSTGKC